MAHTLLWWGKYYLYAIGNTSAVCLTRDITPEETADVLLLGCGDPRNVLYTIFSEPQNMRRKLDFTCCDFEPAILARNVLLFSMLADHNPHTTAIWNIFFHIYIDDESRDLLTDQCQKLVGLSESLRQWNSSPYGHFLKMSTAYTLTEIRRHWSLYIGMNDIPSGRMKSIRVAFGKQYKPTQDSESSISFSTARSSGPLSLELMTIDLKHSLSYKYWQTGVTFTDPKDIIAAKHVNPTFAYSLGGEGCNVHYGSDPLMSFHLACLLGNTQVPITAIDLVDAAKAEFSDWCSVFQSAISPNSPTPPTIRFFLGDALAACNVLATFSRTGTLKSHVPVAPWRTPVIELNEDDYKHGGAPATFNIIDTSNLVDWLGLLNILTASVPLLPSPPLPCVLYSESLLFLGQNATKEFSEHLKADITTMSLLLGICPVDYLSGFTSRSNTHELMMNGKKGSAQPQFHQVTTWKSATSADFLIARSGKQPLPTFDSHQLGTLLYDLYHEIFLREGSMPFVKDQNKQKKSQKAIVGSNVVHDTREGFVLLLKLIRGRLDISMDKWQAAMGKFIDFAKLATFSWAGMYYQDLCGQLQRHGVFAVSLYSQRLPKVGRFRNWDSIPPVVKIVLTVPREKLSAVESSLDRIGTPMLNCGIRGNHWHHLFSSVHAAFGQAIPMGTKENPSVVFRDDSEGRRGVSPLVVSFTVPSHLLATMEPPEHLLIGLMVRSTPSTAHLAEKLGIFLEIFTAPLMDESLVHIVPESMPPQRTDGRSFSSVPPVTSCLSTQFGRSGEVAVDLDQECELVMSLTSRISIEIDDVKKQFRAGAIPHVEQVSSCVMRVSIGALNQDVPFPFPVIGSQNKLRLARKSSYIEIVVPVSGPFKADGMATNRFPLISAKGIPSPWNIHRLNLERLPILNTNQKAEKIRQWLNPHIVSMLSVRERSLRKKHSLDPLLLVKDTIHSIFARSSGIHGGPPTKMFSLGDKATNNCDTILFINDIRYDLHSHTMICDGYVLPLTDNLLNKIEKPFGKLIHGDGGSASGRTNLYEGEVQEWKRLLPAFAERCRTSWTHGDKCEYALEGKIPRSELIETDPLCSCGRGKDVEGMLKVDAWRPFAPHVTRVAVSPLFAVSYLETVIRDPSAHRCSSCRGKGQPKIMTCSGCQKVRYCQRECQKRDWNAHKKICKP